MILLIHCIYAIIHYRMCESYHYVYGLMTGLFTRIILTALPRTYYIMLNYWNEIILAGEKCHGYHEI